MCCDVKETNEKEEKKEEMHRNTKTKK